MCSVTRLEQIAAHFGHVVSLLEKPLPVELPPMICPRLLDVMANLHICRVPGLQYFTSFSDHRLCRLRRFLEDGADIDACLYLKEFTSCRYHSPSHGIIALFHGIIALFHEPQSEEEL